MKVRIQIEVDLGPDSRTFANVEAAVAEAVEAAGGRLGVREGTGHAVRARVETEVDTFGEKVLVRKNVLEWFDGEGAEFAPVLIVDMGGVAG